MLATTIKTTKNDELLVVWLFALAALVALVFYALIHYNAALVSTGEIPTCLDQGEANVLTVTPATSDVYIPCQGDDLRAGEHRRPG